MIRYYVVGNSEWVLLTSPEALYEMFVKKTYDFEKPELVRDLMQHLVGDGIILAEGWKHKVLTATS